MNAIETIDPLTGFIALTAIGLVPLVAVMTTCFTKLVIVIALLRNAIGLQNVPPTMVTTGIAIVLTFFIMYPVGQDVLERLDSGELSQRDSSKSQPRQVLESFSVAREPLGAFLERNSSERDRTFFMNAARVTMPPQHFEKIRPTDLVILIPAFTLTELTEAFQVGFLIFLPFIIIDLIVANVLLAMGMTMMSPTIVSLPFKLLLFILLDGWTRLFNALILSYA